MRNLFICLAFIIVASCSSDDTGNNPQTGNLEVTVRSKDNELIAGALVTTTPATTEKTTGASGVVSFNNIQPGTYSITVELPADIITYTSTAIVTIGQTTSVSMEVGPESIKEIPISIDLLLENSYQKLKDEYLFDANGYSYYWGDTGADILYKNSSNGSPIELEIDLYNFNPAGQIINKAWEAHYLLLRQINTGLDVLESGNFTSEQSIDENEVKAEFHFLRAVLYFNLVKLFGNPIIVTAINTDINNPPPFVQGREEAYNLIIDDLTFAETHLKTSGSTSRASQGASQGLLGKVYMQMAGFPLQQTEKYALALAAFEKLEGAYTLESNYADVFSLENEGNSTEVIFRIPFDQDGSYGFFWGPVGISPQDRYYMVEGFPESFFEIPEDIVSPLTFPLELQDSRFEQNIATFSYENEMVVNEVNVEDWRPYKFQKILGETTNFKSESFDFPYLRYADILLLIAEAENAINGPTTNAYSAINEVRRRAYGDSNNNLVPGLGQQDFQKAVLDERRRELCYEGHRRDDLIRTQELEVVIIDFNLKYPQFFKNYESHKYVWPIPQTELDINQEVQQNLGY